MSDNTEAETVPFALLVQENARLREVIAGMDRELEERTTDADRWETEARRRDRVNQQLAESHRAVVEGLRADLAERDAKIRAIVAAVHAEIRDPFAAAVAPSICGAVDEAVEVIEAATALRAAGRPAEQPAELEDGRQEKPSDPRKELRGNVHHNLQPLIGWVRWLVGKGENIRPQELPEYASRMWNVLDLVDDFAGEPRHGRPADVPGPLPGSGVAAAAVSGERTQ